MTSGLNRRHVIGGATAAAVGLPLLAACGSDTADSATDPASDPTTSSSSSEAGQTPATVGVLAATGDVPVGGCTVFDDEKVVVTQPSEGDFRAFTSICSHQGCSVSASTDGVIPCRCHGSEFSLEDGSVVQGPATAPLSEVAITVDGGSITLA
ncbi:Rieske (2Fe-2S) protein [Nocardioides sp.]|uniref:Rieske (2Fe-2S) protein n=1 Tax=Nocardioides sp. TaxID=35761 RepID=UPI00286D7C10|nr:Rieske (2Fe-2S) protein [Nocardioides sp.]